MPIPLRADFDAAGLRAAARRTKDAAQARRLLALAAVYDGASRTEAARIGGVTVQIVRDWVVRFNAEGPAGLIDRKAPGQASRLTSTHLTGPSASQVPPVRPNQTPNRAPDDTSSRPPFTTMSSGAGKRRRSERCGVS
nr:helix-turn-helix domain-containing protein [Belnapia rosea]